MLVKARQLYFILCVTQYMSGGLCFGNPYHVWTFQRDLKQPRSSDFKRRSAIFQRLFEMENWRKNLLREFRKESFPILGHCSAFLICVRRFSGPSFRELPDPSCTNELWNMLALLLLECLWARNWLMWTSSLLAFIVTDRFCDVQPDWPHPSAPPRSNTHHRVY